MEITDIISDSMHYPFNHIQSLVIYVVLGIIAAIIFTFTGVTATLAARSNSFMGSIMSIVGLIIAILIFFLIDGYVLDIIKYGISRSDDSPSVEPTRQITNGIKLAITQIVYFIIPLIIVFVLSLFLKDWIVIIASIILFVLFGLVASMAQCRLARSDDLSDALAVSEAFSDLSRVGIGKVVLTILAVFVVGFVLIFILTLIGSIISRDIGAILASIGQIYTLFFANRAFGLLYSDA